MCVCARVHCTLDGSDKHFAVDAVDFAVAILAAMPYTRLTLNVAVYPAPATSSGEPPTQVHTYHLSLPDDTRRPTRVRGVPRSTRRTSGQALGSAMVHAIAPAPSGTPGLSDDCAAGCGEVLSQDDVGGAACSAEDAEAAGSDNEDEILRPHGDMILGTDTLRADVQAQPDASGAGRDAVVEPRRK